MKKQANILSIIFLAVSILLMVVPISAKIIFSPLPSPLLSETYSYFDQKVFIYGNYFPFITGILSVFLFEIMTVLTAKNKTSFGLLILLIADIIFSIFSWTILGAFSGGGLTISCLLLGSIIFQLIYRLHK